jgi:hypothetical protein
VSRWVSAQAADPVVQVIDGNEQYVGLLSDRNPLMNQADNKKSSGDFEYSWGHVSSLDGVKADVTL